MQTDEWENCYPSKWKGMIVEGAIAHPAKFSSRLIARIYEHMLSEGWLKPGDLVIDPFGGVALGALNAMQHDLRWRGVELESKFALLGNLNIQFWNEKFSRMPHWCPDARLLQGDSRNLLKVLREADVAGALSSPPYADSMEHQGGIEPSKSKFKGGPHSQMNNSDTRYSAALSSPPYADGAQHEGGDDRHPELLEGTDIHLVGINGAVSSPPYSEARIGQKSGQEQCGHGDQYGATEGQLGAMKADGFDAALSSPPYTGNVAVEKNSKSIDRSKQYEIYRASGGGQTFEAFCATQELHSQGYGEADGQLANMPEGNFEGAVTSPPFQGNHDGLALKDAEEIMSKVAQRYGNNHNRLDKTKLPEYGSSEGNIASDSGSSFWLAARTIVDQVYIALRPGGHAVWVVKGFVKNRQLVDFPGQWQQVCEAAGFMTVHEHHAMLIKHNGTSHTLEGGTVDHIKESKSFFRRLAENKGAPRIDFETVLCMVKPNRE